MSYPFVSLIIPVYNEEQMIQRCLDSIINQDYPKSLMEIIIIDGGSRDRTVERIKKIMEKNPKIRFKLLNNPQKLQGYALNIGIKNCSPESKVILRIDAHSIYPPEYISKCVSTLFEKGVENVGGVMYPIGETSFQKAIAFCMQHPLGVGDSKFHLGNYSGYVDTVYLGCFKRDIFEKVGLFDPKMTPNEDAELNLRIIKNGGRVYLNKDIKVYYYPRNRVIKFILQYLSLIHI